MRRPASMSPSRPGPVVAVSSGSSMSSAVGPSRTLPYTVGATSTPFVRCVGTGNTIDDTSGRASLSKTMSWPRRGAMVNSSWPNQRFDLVGEQSGRVDDPVGPDRALVRVHSQLPGFGVAAHAGDGGAESQLDTGTDRLGGERDARAPGADDRLVRDDDGAGGPVAEVGLAPPELVEGEPGGARGTRWPAPWTARRRAGPLARASQATRTAPVSSRAMPEARA